MARGREMWGSCRRTGGIARLLAALALPLVFGVRGAAAPATARANTPPRTGLIAFVRGPLNANNSPVGITDIYTLAPSGTVTRISHGTGGGTAQEPVWSPDGSFLAWTQHQPGGTIWVANADGSNQHPIPSIPTGPAEDILGWSVDPTTPGGTQMFITDPAGLQVVHLTAALAVTGITTSQLPGNFEDFTVSPDGKRVAYVDLRQVWVTNADGSGAHAITPAAANSYTPSGAMAGYGLAWSPDGSRIAFINAEPVNANNSKYEVATVGPDGSNLHDLTQIPAPYNAQTCFFPRYPSWSPDSRHLVYQMITITGQGSGSFYPIFPCQGFWTVDATGGNQQEILPDQNGQYVDDFPVWQPTPAHHYHIELKAWIPQGRVADPLQLLRLPYDSALLLQPQCLTPANLPGGNVLVYAVTTVTSYFLGDNHAGYDGSDRARVEIDFDYDPSSNTITNFSYTPVWEDTHLVHVYRWPATPLWPAGSYTCTVAKNASGVSSITASASGSSFNVSYQSAQPLIPFSPPIKQQVTGSFEANGSAYLLRLQFSNNMFPSKGIQVQLDGTTQLTSVYTDVSCLSQTETASPVGAVLLARGLTSMYQPAEQTVYPNDAGISRTERSPLCG